MSVQKRVLVVPVEEQSREFDAKLLLACVAAERGYPTIIGSRREIHFRAAHLPKGIYYAKSFRPISLYMFRILTDLGYEIVACDEEGLLPYPDELYFERRVSPETFALISNLFAWGPENAALFRRCPGYTGVPIHVTGNPRVDTMRPEIRGYFDPDVADLHRRFGRFLLVNTNFGTVNHRVPSLAWMKHESTESTSSDDHRADITRHRLALYSEFHRLVPMLSQQFPELTVVIRPHPVEDHDPWRRTAAVCRNVRVVHEGSVIPWLLAATAVVQNNCTTAVEAFLLGRPAISYRPICNEQFDSALTNSVSYQATHLDELYDGIQDLATGRLRGPTDAGWRKSIERHIAALDGPLASDRIVDALDAATAEPRASVPGYLRYASAWVRCHSRALEKLTRSVVPGDKNNRGYQKQRFPGVPIGNVRERVRRYGLQTGRFEGLRVARISNGVFRISLE